MEKQRLLTVKEVAEITGWRESTVRAKILRREIPYFKMGRSVRVSEADLRELLERSRVPARGQR